MRYETVGVTESLLDSAEKEFLQYGFREARLRRISAASGVSTNSIYTRFNDKEGLFGAVVRDAAEGLMEIYLDSIDKAGASMDVEHAIEEGSEGTDVVLKYIYENENKFRLIFCKSAGTEYESYFDRLAAIEESYYKIFAAKYAGDSHKVDDFFIHVYCRTGWQYMYEVLTHDKTYEEAKAYMDNVRAFNYAGWKALLGIQE